MIHPTNIEGVFVEEVKHFPDERGCFNEVIRISSGLFNDVSFAQLSHTVAYENVIKAWHYHKLQTDLWYVTSGVIKAVLYDLREDSVSYKQVFEIVMGQEHKNIVLKIPPMIAHGYKVIHAPAHLVYITTQIYNPDDEGRLPYDSLEYDWFKQVIK